MNTFNRQLLLLAVALTLASPLFAQQKSIQLPADNPLSQLNPGPDQETVHRNCFVCHSTDYIVRQPRLDATHWEAEVKKMITVFGARIADSDAKLIAAYLAKSYGLDADTVKKNQVGDKR